MDARLAGTRLPSLGLYGSPYPSPNLPGYLPYGAAAAASSPSGLYPAMTPGENADAWRVGLSRVAAAYYDPNITAHYSYGGFAPMGLCDGARRKNATRETTSTLKTWLNEHRKNPYPTKGEKIMLAIITKMTLTQVSTWFANARRRLKKENKMTWPPRNRCEDEEEDDDLQLDDLQINENSHRRTPSSSMSSSDNLAPQTFGQKELSGNMRAGDNVFNKEKIEAKDSVLRRSPNDKQNQRKKEEEQTPTFSEHQQSSSDEPKLLDSFSHLSEHCNPLHVDHKETRSFDSFTTPSSLQPTMSRSSIPISTSISHLSRTPPNLNIMHHSISGPLNHAAAAASIIAASRGHSLPPHIMAALNEQIQYQKALQSFPVNPFRNALPEPSKLPSIPTPSNAPSSPGSLSRNSSSPSSSTEQAKPKIWSLANVATSSDSSKNLREEQLLEDRRSKDGFDDANIRNWVDNVMQQNLAMAASGQYCLGSGLNQQIEKLTSGVNLNGINCTISQNQFTRQFQELTGLTTLRDKTQVDVKASNIDPQRSHCVQATHERSLTSSKGQSVNVPNNRPTPENDSINRYVSSPSGSQRSGSISEATST